jgi:hypothetical protein
MSAQQNYSTTLFSASFSAFPVSSTGGASAYDLWSIKASSAGRVEVHSIRLAQQSSAVASNQQLSIQVFTGSTALGGGGTSTPVNLKRWATAPVAGSSATAPSSNLASTASATLLFADASDVSGAWTFKPDGFSAIVLEAGQALNVRVSAPPATALLSGSLVFKELTKP